MTPKGDESQPAKSYLYVNVRPWPENARPHMDQPPPISSAIELRIVDLETLEV